jgi:hypothetical protein
MTERLTDEKLRELAGGEYRGSRRIAPLAAELLALRASNRSAYREIKRLRQIADLSKIDWVDYCNNVYAFLLGEQARLRAQEKRQHAAWRKAIEATQERHVNTGESACFATADDLEDEVILVDLEFTDPDPILAVNCETTHLERLAA